MGQVSLTISVPLYGCLGFLDVFTSGKLPFGGLTTEAELYILSVAFGNSLPFLLHEARS